MNNIKVEFKDEKAIIYTPYNPYFVSKIKKIGGAKWDGAAWSISEVFIDAAREIMDEVYGYNDLTINETINLKITFNTQIEVKESKLMLFGKILSNSGVGRQIGEDVAYIKGRAFIGGSRKHWTSAVEEGSVVILANVNKNIYEREKDDIPYDITIDKLTTHFDRSKLEKEKRTAIKTN